MIIKPHQIETLDDGFQNIDADKTWLDHEPTFEWTEDDLAEFERDRLYAEQEAHAMACWWEHEGVKCATFGRDPNVNPYL
jgi:hypothetical protein